MLALSPRSPSPRLAPSRFPRAVEPAAAAESFYWLGWNYLLKMTLDLAFAPLPVGSDPLLLNWFHYDSPRHESRAEGLHSPPDEDTWRESEWWFDAERLHSEFDILRMRHAQQELLDELSRFPAYRQPPLTGEVLLRPKNDLGRELELLLYGEIAYATVTRRSRGGCTTVARRWHGGCTARRLHDDCTTVARRLHDGCTMVTRR